MEWQDLRVTGRVNSLPRTLFLSSSRRRMTLPNCELPDHTAQPDRPAPSDLLDLRPRDLCMPLLNLGQRLRVVSAAFHPDAARLPILDTRR